VDTQAQILDAAMHLFARKGFDGTPLQAICDEVGITKPTLLYYYPSKEALRRAVLCQLIEHWRETLPRLLAAVTSGYKRFDALTGELVRFFRADPDRARLVMRELLDNPEDMRAKLVESLRPWILLIAEYVKQGQASGTLHEDVDAESYVMHVITLVTATVANIGVLPRMLSPGDKVRESEERYLAELSRLARTALFRPKKKKAIVEVLGGDRA
jgi:AcrR family transcriptional regulator